MTLKTLRANDWTTAQAVTASTYFPHELRPLTRERPDFRLSSLAMGPALIGRIRWGGDVSIACSYDGYVEVNAPLSGAFASTSPRGDIHAGQGSATVFAPGEPRLITRWGRECEVLGVKFDSAWLTAIARASFGASGLIFLPDQLDLRSHDAAEWFNLARGLHQAAPANPAVLEPLARSLAIAFLAAALPADAGREGGSLRGIVERVTDAIEADPAHPWTAADMAAAAGVGIRRMQEAFAKQTHHTPRQELLRVRLTRAREEVQSGDATITDIASKWGFTNPGRFATVYRQHFGLRPSEDRQ